MAGAINVGTEIVNDIIVTGHLVTNAVTNADVVSATSGTSLSGTITTSGGPVLVIAIGNITGVSGGPSANCQISNLTTSASGLPVHYTANTPIALMFWDNAPPAAGANQYSVGIFGTGTTGSFQSMTMYMVELKR